jgi:xanthine dehydrogenase YagT iron-sulfur-binding subunit
MPIKDKDQPDRPGTQCLRDAPRQEQPDQVEACELSSDGASRRRFLTDAGVVTATLIATQLLPIEQVLALEQLTASQQRQKAATRGAIDVRLRINGKEHLLKLEPRVTLLDALRERLRLTGTKKGCDHGQCGACTVLINNRRINSCLALAVMYEGTEITTVEGLSSGHELHPVQAAFIKHDGFQCGYCTSGQICSAVGLLEEVRSGAVSAVTTDIGEKQAEIELTDMEIRERMSGNLCRCGAYNGIVAAVREASHNQTRRR